MALYLGNQQISALSADTATKTWVGQQGYLTELPETAVTKSDLDASIGAINSSVNTALGNIETALDGKYSFTITGDWTEGGSSVSGKPIHCLPLDKGVWYNGESTMNTDTYGYTVVHDTTASESIYGDFPISFSATKSYVSGQLSGKQDSLVSGTNIKTINNQSILGSGNLTIDLTIYEVVQTLPSQDINANKIYLVPMSDGSTATNQFDEYVYANNTWEKIGSIEGGNVDLDDYLTIANASANFVSNASLDDDVSALNYVKSSTLNDYLLSATASSTYATIASLDDYVLNASLDDEVSTLGYIKSNDVSNFVTDTTVSATYATKSEISGFKNIVQCTDAEYAALVQAGTVDANTVYLTYTPSA